jgi:tetratricopeptide (TPR) repeat protein
MDINQNKLDKDIILSNNSKVTKYSSESLKKGLNLATEIENINLNNQDKDWLNNGIELYNLGEYEKALFSFDKALK